MRKPKGSKLTGTLVNTAKEAEKEVVVKPKTNAEFVKELEAKGLKLSWKKTNNINLRLNSIVKEVGLVQVQQLSDGSKRPFVVLTMIVPTIFVNDIKEEKYILVEEKVVAIGRYAVTLKNNLKVGMGVQEYKSITRNTRDGGCMFVLSGFMHWGRTKVEEVSEQAPADIGLNDEVIETKKVEEKVETKAEVEDEGF